jgi:2-polyprenyl-3-methyl-5-hydroxy-6-metoxy-1,4-benzoquinol methylase
VLPRGPGQRQRQLRQRRAASAQAAAQAAGQRRRQARPAAGAVPAQPRGLTPTTGCCPACEGEIYPALGRLAPRLRQPYFRCRRCGLLGSRPDPAREREFYEIDYPGLPHKAQEPERRRALYERLLDDLPRGTLRLLDVGCGSGAFLARARERGLDVVGLELSQAAAAAAREQASARVVIGEPAALAPALRFDVITLWNVLDHVPDPLRLLGECRQRLAPGGRLFARVPNGAVHRPLTRLHALAPGAGWLGRFTPLHPWLLRPRDLERLALRAGFAAAQVEVRASPPAAGSRLRPLLGGLARALAALSLGHLQLAPSLELHASCGGPTTGPWRTPSA